MRSRTFAVTVTDPAGPRAAVTAPAFDCAAPLLSAAVVNAPEPTVHMRLDCSEHPGAARFLAAREHDTFHVSVQMWTHETGNGYVVLHVDSNRDVTEAGPAGEVDVVLDPVVHAQVIGSIAGAGRLLITANYADGGWFVTVDPAAVMQAHAAACAHPRQVGLRWKMPRARRQP